MTVKSHALLFDLDGTLVDTAPDLLLALNAVLASAGRRPLGLAALKAMVGGGVRILLQRAFEATGAPITPPRLPELEAQYLTEYGRQLTANSRPFPHVQDTLIALRQGGAHLAVLTNKPQALTERLLNALDLAQYFAVIRGAETSCSIKPDARVVAEVIAALGGSTSDAVMIGDSATDVATARSAALPIVLVSYGYSPRPPAELGADAVIADFSELRRVLSPLRRQ
jgi:phosphoglycolate phosphatase